MDAAGGALGHAGAVLLTATCAVATYRAAVAGDVASVAFVVVSYGVLEFDLSFYWTQRPIRTLIRSLIGGGQPTYGWRAPVTCGT
jgi:hypothetical protein